MISFTKKQQEYIDSYYMPLPVDADGETIHPGDTLYVKGGGYGIEDAQLFLASNGFWSIAGRRPDEFVHVYDSIGRIVQDMRNSISEHVGLAPDEVLAFVERLEKRLERLGDAE